MLNFDWLTKIRTGRTSRPKRRRSAKRSLVRQANLECLQPRAMLSGNPVATMAMGESGADSGHTSSMHQTSTTQHTQHAHPAAMALVSADQATNTVIASGDWSNPAVWQNGELPTAGARIIIPQGMTLTVDSVIPTEFKTIGIHGTLNFATDVNTELRVDTIVSAPHGRFEMGTAANPIAANVTARVVFSDDGVTDRTWDPEQLSRGAILQGPTEIHGAATTHNVSLAVQPTAGTSTLQLSAAPSGWNVGDEVIITGTNGPTSDEVRTISAIDGASVTLNTPLSQDHIAPKAGLNVYLANTTRNVEFTSENTATAHRGHIMFMHTNNVNVTNAKFTELGRTDKKIPLDDLNFDFTEDAVGNTTSAGVVFTTTPGARNNVRGRYPVHFHRGGTTPRSTPGVVDGSVVVGSPGYGLVNHSSNVHLTNNVSYDIHGSAFYTEAGDEIGTIENNIAIRTVNPDFRLEDNGEISVDLRADVQDFGVDGDGFWLSGHLVSMKNNIAAGASGHGIIIWSDGLVEADRGRTTVRTADIENGHLIQGRDTIPTWWAPLAEISNNEAFNATTGFRARYIHSSIYLGDVGSPFHEPPSQEYIDTLRPEINGLKVWGSRDGALLNYNERLSLKNAEFVGIGAPYVRQGGTTDLGVGIDMYNDVSRGPGVVENVSVEGYNMGILAPRHNGWQMNNIHLRNTTDLHIEQATGTNRVLELSNITFGDLAGTAVTGNEGQRQNIVMQGSNSDVEQPFWFLMTDTVTLDGQGLYYNEQAANHVPLTEDNRGEARIPAPVEFVGLTNQQLQNRYGTSFAGEITPDDAQAVSWLSGGVVGSLPSPGQTTPPLLDLRDGGEGSYPDLGNLTNFDTNQLPTEGPDDDEAGDGEETDEGDDETGDGEETDEGDDEAGDGEETDEGDDETGDGEETDEGDDETGDGEETDEGDDETGDGEETDEGDDETEDGEETDEGDDETGDGEETDEGDDEAGDGKETDEGDDETGDGEETDEEDDETGDGEETDEGDDETGDGEETDEGDDEAGDGEETDEGDDEAGDGEETDEGDDEIDGGGLEPEEETADESEDSLPELETPQGNFTLTITDSVGEVDLVVAGNQMLVLSGDAAIQHVDLSGVTQLTVHGSDASETIMLDLEEAGPLGLESITINGGAGDDSIQVQGFRREIATTLTINGDDGNDSATVASSRSGVNLNGGSGNDRLDGGRGADTISGGAGNDFIQGRGGNDVISGDDGNDVLNGHGGHDTLSGGAGRDRINGHSGRDVLRGEAGNDVLAGGGGGDLLLGGSGRDRMRGQGGNDTIVGGEGADILKGGAGNDVLESGINEDVKQGGAGIDTLLTGNGGGRQFEVLGQLITSDDFAVVASDSGSLDDEEPESAGDANSIDLGFESVSDWFDTI